MLRQVLGLTLILRPAVLPDILWYIVQNTSLLLTIELLLFEVDLESTFDHDESESTHQHPLEVIPDRIEKNATHNGGNCWEQ